MKLKDLVTNWFAGCFCLWGTWKNCGVVSVLLPPGAGFLPSSGLGGHDSIHTCGRTRGHGRRAALSPLKKELKSGADGPASSSLSAVSDGSNRGGLGHSTMLVAFPVHCRGGTWHHGSSGSEGVRTRLGDMGPRDATREELA